MSKQPDPARNQPTPGVPMADSLRADVAHAQRRLDLAQQLLREWLLSHPEDERPASVYTTRGLTEHRLDGSSWRRG
jgi:hypothetical protein